MSTTFTRCLYLPLTPSVADLIRHGKNHTARQHNDAGQYEFASPQQQQQQQQPQPQYQQAQRQAREQPREGQQQQQTQKTASPKYKEEVEKIVQEEREAKSKMPTYKGLENYRLLDKMGEYVVNTPRYVLTSLALTSSTVPLFLAAPSLMYTRQSTFGRVRRSQVSEPTPISQRCRYSCAP